MRLVEVVWVREIAEKVRQEHGLKPEEVEEVCFGTVTHIRKARGGCYAHLGRTEAGRYVIVFYRKLGQGRTLIVTARDMTDSERGLYERHAL